MALVQPPISTRNKLSKLEKRQDATAIHPGYGFLSEKADFARRCDEAGIMFVGPRPEILELFGDKVQARSLASRCGIPLLRGSVGPTSLDEASEFFSSLGDGASMMIKAVAGGGGRGMRIVHRAEEIAESYKRCQSEARAAFGNGDVYVEQLMPRARHIEVQIIGDKAGGVSHLWERECSIQRRNQKIVEVAPSPGLAPAFRDRLTAAAVRMASEVHYDNLGTFEFLVNAASAKNDEATFAFIEANPRLQVEHTVTEEVTGIDLVKLQVQLAAGRTLAELQMRQSEIPKPRGFAIQMRINMESMSADGSAKPTGGTLTAFDAPSGPGVRTDSFAYAGYTTSPNFDSLLAKVIAHSASTDFAAAVAKAYRALCEFRIEGVSTNVGFLQSLLRHPEFVANRIYTRFVEDNIGELVGPPKAGPSAPFLRRAAWQAACGFEDSFRHGCCGKTRRRKNRCERSSRGAPSRQNRRRNRQCAGICTLRRYRNGPPPRNRGPRKYRRDLGADARDDRFDRCARR